MKRQPPHARGGGDAPAGESGSASGGEFKKGKWKGKGRWGGGGSRRRNEQRLGVSGGGALSLAAFASAKSRNTGYNPALIKSPGHIQETARDNQAASTWDAAPYSCCRAHWNTSAEELLHIRAARLLSSLTAHLPLQHVSDTEDVVWVAFSHPQRISWTNAE